jgi:hypothetical protein
MKDEREGNGPPDDQRNNGGGENGEGYGTDTVEKRHDPPSTGRKAE